jgi:hypothetical protein
MVSGGLGEKMKATGGQLFLVFFFLQRGCERPFGVREKKRSSDGGRLLFCLAELGRDEF